MIEFPTVYTMSRDGEMFVVVTYPEFVTVFEFCGFVVY